VGARGECFRESTDKPNYALTVTDATTSGNNISTTQSCAAATCVDASAEWIAEARAARAANTRWRTSRSGPPRRRR